MADVQAGKRYAQAAFSIARESNTVGTWRSELNDIATVLTESGLAPVLADPKVALDKRFSLVERTLDISPMALNLAKLLVQKGRAGDARAVADAFERLADEYEGIAHAEVTTAVALTPGKLEEIEKQLTAQVGKTVKASSKVDPTILGGVVVRVGDRLVDGSVRTRLRRLRRELEGAR